MKHNFNNLQRGLALLGLSAILLPHAVAQETIMRNDMWDFDQKRSGLVDNGIYYCVPTSYVDMFEYMANHGLPGMDASYTNSYSDITTWIYVLGLAMGTNSADKGTSGNNAWTIGNWWISNYTNQFICMYKYSPGNDWSWRTIRNLMRLGALCRIGRGKYQNNGNGYWERVGGHAVMVAGFLDDGNGNRSIVVADPNNDTSLTTQAPFELVAKPTSDITFTTENHGVVTHARYTFSTGNGIQRFVIDGMHAVVPYIAGWTVNTGDTNTFTWRVPFQMNEATHAWPTTFTFSTRFNVVDWCYDMLKGGVVYLTDTGKVYEQDPFDGDVNEIADVPGAKKIAIGGPRQDLYVLDEGPLTDELRYIPRKGSFGVVKSLGGRYDALDFDPVKGGPVVTRVGLNKFLTFSRSLGVRQDEVVLNLSLIPPRAAGETLFQVDYETGDYLLSSDGSDTVYRYKRHANRRVETFFRINSTAGIRSICPAPLGLNMVQIGSRIQTMDNKGNLVTSAFSNMTVPTKFQGIRTEFAADPSDFTAPGWWDEVPGPNEP